MNNDLATATFIISPVLTKRDVPIVRSSFAITSNCWFSDSLQGLIVRAPIPCVEKWSYTLLHSYIKCTYCWLSYVPPAVCLDAYRDNAVLREHTRVHQHSTISPFMHACTPDVRSGLSTLCRTFSLINDCFLISGIKRVCRMGNIHMSELPHTVGHTAGKWKVQCGSSCTIVEINNTTNHIAWSNYSQDRNNAV